PSRRNICDGRHGPPHRIRIGWRVLACKKMAGTECRTRRRNRGRLCGVFTEPLSAPRDSSITFKCRAPRKRVLDVVPRKVVNTWGRKKTSGRDGVYHNAHRTGGLHVL